MWHRGVFLTDEVIQEKGRRLQSSLNLFNSPEEQTHIRFSNGQIDAFKKRHQFKCYKSHGEGGDADHPGAEAALPQLRQLAGQFQLADIFYADEFGLFYTQAPRRTIGPAPLLGRKNSKARLTFLVCTNVDGTDKLPPLMIGRARRPQCFNGLTAEQLGLDYDYSAESWMNIEIFCRWLLRVEKYVSLTPGRKILLFLDNASSHGSIDNLPNLRNVRIQFLPKRTTPIL